MSAKPKNPKSTTREGYGIVNPYGDMWTTDIFVTPDGARQHLRDFWRGMKTDISLESYRIVRAVQRTSLIGEMEPI